MSEDERLFDMPTQERLRAGERVTVQLSWGDEPGTVAQVHPQYDFPMVSVTLDNGDLISIQVARVRRSDAAR